MLYGQILVWAKKSTLIDNNFDKSEVPKSVCWKQDTHTRVKQVYTRERGLPSVLEEVIKTIKEFLLRIQMAEKVM